MSDQRLVSGPIACDGHNHSGKPSCLILHGLGGGPYELSPLIAALEGEGLRVSAPVLPGHEGPGPVMPGSCWRDWAKTAESAFEELSRGRATRGRRRLLDRGDARPLPGVTPAGCEPVAAGPIPGNPIHELDPRASSDGSPPNRKVDAEPAPPPASRAQPRNAPVGFGRESLSDIQHSRHLRARLN